MGLARLSPAQIKQLQRVFYAVDRDEDNVVSESDVVKTLRSLGERDAAGEAPQYLGADATGADARGGIDATSFLTMFGTRMGAVADARKLLDAFECFDERDEGVIEVGRLTQRDRMLVPPFLDRSGKRFDYRKFVETLGMEAWDALA